MTDLMDYLIVIVMCAVLFSIGFSLGQKHEKQVDIFTDGMTITVKCSGACDLAAMIAEAREAK